MARKWLMGLRHDVGQALGPHTLRRETSSSVDSSEDLSGVFVDYRRKGAWRRYVWATVLGRDAQKKVRIGRLDVKVLKVSGASSNVELELEGRVWRGTETSFFVNRSDAVLRVQVDNGSVRVPVSRLAGHDIVERWFDLDDGKVQLELKYDVSPFGEASSRLWLPDPGPIAAPPPFDVNDFYKNVVDFKAELAPYIDAVNFVERSLKWTNLTLSRVALLIAAVHAWRFSSFFPAIHLYIAAFMLANLVVAFDSRRLAWTVFKKTADLDDDDDDKMRRTLSRSNVDLAVERFAAARHCTWRPSEKLLDKLFVDHARGKSRLTFSGFRTLLADCPKIVAADRRGVFSRQDTDSGSLDDVLEGGDSPEEEEEEKVVQEEASAVRGPLAKQVLNSVGQRISVLVYASTKIRGYGKILAFGRRVLEWDPKLTATSAAAFTANLLAVVVAGYAPRVYFLSVVGGAFFYYTDKRRALERFVKVAPTAFRRYTSLTDRKDLDLDILVDDGKPIHLVKGDVPRDDTVRDIARALFARLDTDDSGTIDSTEILRYALVAIPRAPPSIRDHVDDPADIRTQILQVINDFDKNGDGQLDFDEMYDFITTFGCSRILHQDELRRRLRLGHDGVPCLKFPSLVDDSDKSSSCLIFSGSHHRTLLSIRDDRLTYTNRHGTVKLLHTIYDVLPADKSDLFHVVHAEPPRFQRKTLVLAISDVLRDNLVDVLNVELLGKDPHYAEPDDLGGRTYYDPEKIRIQQLEDQ